MKNNMQKPCNKATRKDFFHDFAEKKDGNGGLTPFCRKMWKTAPFGINSKSNPKSKNTLSCLGGWGQRCRGGKRKHLQNSEKSKRLFCTGFQAMRAGYGASLGRPLAPPPSCLELVQNSTCHLVHLIRKRKTKSRQPPAGAAQSMRAGKTGMARKAAL